MKLGLKWGELPYEKRVYEVLSAYRLFAYVIAVVVIILLAYPEEITAETYVLFALVGAYTIFKAFAPLRIYEKDIWNYLIFGGDVLVCIVLVLITGGLNSGFLLYSLCPIIAASFLLEPRVSFPAAGVFSFSLIIAHTFFGYTQTFVSIMEGNLITSLAIYVIITFLIPVLAYRTNVNVHRHIEGQAISYERKRIAREMHDDTVQKLAYLNMKAKLLGDRLNDLDEERRNAEIGEMKSIIEDAYKDVRESVNNLYIRQPQKGDLAAEVERSLEDFRNQTGIETKLSSSIAKLSLPPFVTTQLLRVVQEALANVRKHARASRVLVQLKKERAWLNITIKDNGCGFSQGELDWTSHHGLRIMKERVEELGGKFHISSMSNGTEVKISLPVER
ncbi:MAG: sensor histidine kinase [Chloroflexota bacterium]